MENQGRARDSPDTDKTMIDVMEGDRKKGKVANYLGYECIII